MRTAGDKWQEIGRTACKRGVDGLCLQEMRIHKERMPAFRNCMQNFGYKVAFGEECVGRAGVVYNGLVTLYKSGEHLKLRVLDSRTQLAVQVQCKQRRPLMIINLHCKADSSVEDKDKWAQPIRSLGGDVLAIGDWNVEPDEAPVATWLATGRARITDHRDCWCECTSTASHIDYGLWFVDDVGYKAKTRVVFPGLDSDHKWVQYDIG